MQPIGNENSLRNYVRPTEDIRLLTLDVQPTFSVYELNKLLAISNEICV